MGQVDKASPYLLHCKSKIITNIAKRPFGNVAKFKYLGTAIINQNMIHEEIKERI
jgi:hypothetical protein